VAGNLLLCTDLDRTLLPNGAQPESAGAREALKALIAESGMLLAYVSGRRLELQEAAIAEFDLPVPNFAITDVGTGLFRRADTGWEKDSAWEAHIATSWRGHSVTELASWMKDLSDLVLQEAAAQGPFKLSYDVRRIERGPDLVETVKSRLAERAVDATVVWSVDETVPLGLLDVLPTRAGKLNAVRWLAGCSQVAPDRLVFAGDSGNDLEVLVSEIPAVLVANATDEVRQLAQALARENGCEQKLHVAMGGCLGMNGHYASGILEGLAHFVPELRDLLVSIKPKAERLPNESVDSQKRG
jgi:HAD superfamily hydrolase (TIGR01484 family)